MILVLGRLISKALRGTDKLTHTRGLELQNSCGDTIITDRWLHFERNLMQNRGGVLPLLSLKIVNLSVPFVFISRLLPQLSMLFAQCHRAPSVVHY